MAATDNEYERIPGWGVDADPGNDPTYPIKNRMPDVDHAGYTWPRPAQQPVEVEVLHSVERPNVSAVHGTSTPPAGLSGVLRRFAFRFSESSYGHWLPLMLADRIGVAEGILVDLRGGRVPNIFAELGWRAEWRHNRRDLIGRNLLRAGLVAGAIAWLRSRRDG
ncbi:MAG TPA: hypothetical protein VD886_08895 [Herpetosiphonaceae bacterium]|nr:hypothetical protein [Herpetosiphonaceae bacterium]